MDVDSVLSIEVKRYFLLADAGKALFGKEKNIFQLAEDYKRIFDEIFSLEETYLDERIKDKLRLDRYNSVNWHRSYVNFETIGPYPQMKGLDARLTAGNVPETTRMIEDLRDGKLDLEYTDKEEKEKRQAKFQRFLNKSSSFQRNLIFVYENFPMVLLPSGTIRGDYNHWIETEKLNLPLCRNLEHDLDDGSERAINYSMAGIKSAECFYGTPKD